MTDENSSRSISHATLRARQQRPSQQSGLLLIGAPGRPFSQAEFGDGPQYLIERTVQALGCVRFHSLSRDSANRQSTLLRSHKQRVSKVVAVRGMNECVRGENRWQRNLLAAR